jgi:hypothetical protein
VVGIKYKMDLLERLAVTQFPRKLIAPTYLDARRVKKMGCPHLIEKCCICPRFKSYTVG